MSVLDFVPRLRSGSIRVPERDCPVTMDGYMAEIKGYGRLCGSGRLQDIIQMCATFGIKPGHDMVRYYRHIKWADGREWTKRVHDYEPEIESKHEFLRATEPLRTFASHGVMI